MAKISLEQIKETLEPLNWVVISEEYQNLTTEMHFKCPNQHDVYLPWSKLRNKIECPVCKQNTYLAPDGKIEPKHKGITRTLALDQASHITGFAIFDGVELIQSGIYEARGNNEVERIISVKNWLLSMLRTWKPDIVGIEGIQFQEQSAGRTMGVTVFETLARLQGVLMTTCVEQGIHYEVCPTNTWRHQCGVKGKTRADKKRSMQILVKDWYDIKVSDDIADAIGIGYYLCHKVDKFIAVENWET